MAQPLPKTVRCLGLVSLLTDASSELIFPLLPASVLMGWLWQAQGPRLAFHFGAAQAAVATVALAAVRLRRVTHPSSSGLA